MIPGYRSREKAAGRLRSDQSDWRDTDIVIILGLNLRKPSIPTVDTKPSVHSNESEALDASDELLDNLVKNATLTASKDAIKQRRTARYAQRQSRTSSRDTSSPVSFISPVLLPF